MAIGSLLIVGIARLFIRWIQAGTAQKLFLVGLEWVALTVLFEIALGWLILGLPWERMTEDYDIFRGGFMGLGLLFMALTPSLVAKLRGRLEKKVTQSADLDLAE